ncbi:MAG TPA: hypothetical protein G4O00_13665 [Thermoflexia bacterium]|nr:hypothetical protein [Thermoflexia bacterium]
MGEVWGPSSGRPVPRLLASLPCEDAALSQGVADGRVSLQRVFFDLYADRFPAGFDRMTVANFWAGGEGTYRTTIRLVGPDGEEVARGEAELAFPEGAVTVAQLVYFPGLALPGPGTYAVEVLLDDTPVHTYTLVVVGPEGTEEVKGDEQG